METIPAEFQWIGGLVFAATMAVLAARSHFSGKKNGPPKVQEFHAAAELQDMGPVKELVAQTGLLFQQQVRTNVHLEAHIKKQGQTAIALQGLAQQVGRLATAYEAHVADEQREREIEDEVERRIRERAGK